MLDKMNVREAERILGLGGAYGETDVSKAFHMLAKKYHPDLCKRNGISKEEAEEKMSEINVAKASLDEALAIGNLYDEGVVATSPNEPRSDSAADTFHESATATSEVPDDKDSVFGFTVKDGKATPSEKGQRVLWEYQLEASLFYRLLAHFPYFLVILVAGWTLPFYVFGGLNIIPIWKGFIEPSGVDFFVFYALVPFAALANFILPIHPIDWVLHKVTCGLYKAIRGAIYDMSQ